MAVPSITVHCPDCGSELIVDSSTGDVIEHRRPASRPRAVDLSRSQDLLRREQQQREQRLQTAIDAEKRRDQLLAEKFDRGLQRARENPGQPRPLRDIDLD